MDHPIFRLASLSLQLLSAGRNIPSAEQPNMDVLFDLMFPYSRTLQNLAADVSKSESAYKNQGSFLKETLKNNNLTCNKQLMNGLADFFDDSCERSGFLNGNYLFGKELLCEQAREIVGGKSLDELKNMAHVINFFDLQPIQASQEITQQKDAERSQLLLFRAIFKKIKAKYPNEILKNQEIVEETRIRLLKKEPIIRILPKQDYKNPREATYYKINFNGSQLTDKELKEVLAEITAPATHQNNLIYSINISNCCLRNLDIPELVKLFPKLKVIHARNNILTSVTYPKSDDFGDVTKFEKQHVKYLDLCKPNRFHVDLTGNPPLRKDPTNPDRLISGS